ncbi:hypothetical protein B0H10DRAFT_2040819 [Mycena sp. CBHHK59/15]|nr:hypothetical protein B0H10DRAFT_2040819 [Mycena sp. CBHHK59/15]
MPIDWADAQMVPSLAAVCIHKQPIKSQSGYDNRRDLKALSPFLFEPTILPGSTLD